MNLSITTLDGQLATLAAQTRGTRTPALSYAVATTTGLATAGAVGHADLHQERVATIDDQLPWFSMTKVATATAATRLAAQDALQLDAPIGLYLPMNVSGKHVQPTMRQLLTHTAGLSNPVPIGWIRPAGQPPDPELITSVLRKHGRPRRAPGQGAAYSNIGYLLAGQVIEAVTGVSVEQAVTDLVLRPLRMVGTGYDYDLARPQATGYVRAPRVVDPMLRRLLPDDVTGDRVGGYTALRPFLVEGAAYGGLVGTPSDAARLALAHLGNDGPLGDLSTMRQVVHQGKPFDHGIGWFRKPSDAGRTPPFVEHYGTGGGFWNAMRIYPTLGIAMVGMTNNTASWTFDAFFGSVVRLLQEHGLVTAHD